MKQLHYAWYVIAALSALLWLPHLFAYGMFMDGVYNALLAKNLYLGISTFWMPQSVDYTQPASWGTPPLSIGLLACCYKLFGDAFFVERIYSLACAILQIILINRMWLVFFADDAEVKKFSWLPCFLFVVSPLIGWCYSSNLMENTMSLFTSASIILMLSYVKEPKRMMLIAAITAFILFMAFITKGPAGLFPFAVPVLFVGINNNYKLKQAVLFSLFMTFIFCVLFAVLLSFDAPALFLQNYFGEQIMRSLNHEIKMEYKPYQIFIDLAVAISLYLVLVPVVLFFRNRVSKNKSTQTSYWRFILLGLCGSIPIALSIKQRKFYLLPAMVAYAFGFAVLLQPYAEMLEAKLMSSYKIGIKIICVFIVFSCLVLSVMNRNSFVRDEVLLKDLRMLQQKTGGEKLILADWAFYDQWLMRGYLFRLHGKKICMPGEATGIRFCITPAHTPSEIISKNARKIFAGESFDLYDNSN